MPTLRKNTSRTSSARRLRIRGLMVAVVLAVGGTVLYQATTGRYDDKFKLTSEGWMLSWRDTRVLARA